jgi:hypothetical protein
MIKRHPYRAVGVVLAVFLPSLLVAAMIGQHNDGPWGGLPEWLGRTAYATWFISGLVLVALSIYLGIANLRYRRAVR